jgi:hypothetical protein
MKKNIILTVCTFITIVSFSCDESFNPKAPFKEQYVLNCIIRGDSTTQVALLSKTYDVTGFYPTTNDIDPAVTGAQVYLKWKGKMFQLRDSSIVRSDTSRYKTPYRFYYTNAFKPAFNDSVEIIAIPAPGVLLSSKTKVPYNVYFGNSPSFIRGDELVIDIAWTARELGDFFLPRMKIIYRKTDDSPGIIRSFEVPVDYALSNGLEIPKYPGISAAPGIEFLRSNIDKAMLRISEGDDKSKYKFKRIDFELLIFDQFLAGYISTTNGFLDNLSIRLDEPNYTNISGGLGIFGAYEYNLFQIALSEQYLNDLGYTL